MAFLAGERITAARLNRLRSQDYWALCTSALTRTDTTYADITGATVTFTTEAVNAEYNVVATYDCAVGTSSASTRMLGRIMTDGVAESVFGIHEMDNLDRDSVVCTTKGTLTTSGSHTIKLQGALSAAVGSGTFQTFTSILVTVTEVA